MESVNELIDLINSMDTESRTAALSYILKLADPISIGYIQAFISMIC